MVHIVPWKIRCGHSFHDVFIGLKYGKVGRKRSIGGGRDMRHLIWRGKVRVRVGMRGDSGVNR